jgi:S1-C subfamily serine protease
MEATMQKTRKMYKFFCSITLCVSLGIFLPLECGAASTAEIFKRYSPGVATLMIVKKDGKSAQGTGFLVSSRGELLTNFHVVDNADSIQVNFSEHLQYFARRIVAQDPEKDVALLWIEGISPNIYPLSLSQTKLPEGSDIVVIGTPRGFDKSVTAGILSGYRTLSNASLVQFSAPISHGSSGSPVLDTNGKVIGIAIGTIKDSQGVNLAVDAKEIADFLRARPFKTPAVQENRGQPSSAAQSNAANSPAAAGDAQTPLPFAEILAKLERALPRQSSSMVRQSLGAPDKESTGGEKYDTWDFLNNKALLLVWYGNDVVDRSTWVEYHTSREDAASRLESLWTSAAQSLGKHSGASQSGRVWKRGDYSMGIELQSRQTTYMVIFKAVH